MGPLEISGYHAPMLWLKTFHIVFVVSWFAGMFYLPRLFVYHAEMFAEGDDERGHARFCVMERRLLKMTHFAGTLAFVFGFALLWVIPGFLEQAWMWLKLIGVALLTGYHASLSYFVNKFRTKTVTQNAKWFRFYNEAPVLVLVAVVALVEFKPLI